MTVNSREQAFIEAGKIMTSDYEYDSLRSNNAGYPIYFTTARGKNEWISDLGNRLEVNYGKYGSKTENIWIDERPDFDKTMERHGFHKNFLGIWVH